MRKEQAYRLIKEFKENWLPNNGYIADGINSFPRVEVYESGTGEQIDKGDNSRAVSLVFDVITECRNEGLAASLSEQLIDDLESNPIVVPDFNIDMVIYNGSTPLEEEASNDNRTINRRLLNYTYNLTQINF